MELGIPGTAHQETPYYLQTKPSSLGPGVADPCNPALIPLSILDGNKGPTCLVKLERGVHACSMEVVDIERTALARHETYPIRKL